jgi:SAM-dependent methyltransferase
MKIENKEPFKDRQDFVNYFTRCRKQIIDKNELILDLCRGKNVLDLGCIDHSAATALELGNNWLHKQIKDVAYHVIGIDILEEDTNKLNDIGFEIICADVENFDLGRTYDVIVAGDLIEHLSNIGLFLNSVRNHMHEDTILIITTPNPFNIEQTMSAIFDNVTHVNYQHTTWLSPHNFWELSIRHNLFIVDFYWVNTRFHFKVIRKYFNYFVNVLSDRIIKKRNICKPDYAVIMKIKCENK